MTSRILNDYSKDASLWDSAFFGVLGGVVFQGGASKLNRLDKIKSLWYNIGIENQ